MGACVVIARDEREDRILVAYGALADMEAQGETLPSLWCAVADRAADRAGLCSSFAKRVMIGMGFDPSDPLLADDEMRRAIEDAALAALAGLLPMPAAVDLDQYADAVAVMTIADWPYFEQMAQALCIVHGISDAAAISALWHVCDQDDANLERPACRTAMIMTASLFIHHSETVQ